MLMIKLQPFGKKGDHHYRFVVIEGRTKLTGIPVESFGSYNPKSQQVTIKQDRLEYWLKQGVRPSDKVRELCKIS